MSILRKILLCPYFGEFPEWFDKYTAPKGYDMLIDRDLEGFKKRVKDKLGIDYPGQWGEPKVWDYRCALGLLYEEEIKEYAFWGHADFDVVWGDMDHFLPDFMLKDLDVYSSHNQYVCGCFSLYRNSPFVNDLFKRSTTWRAHMEKKEATGWVEQEFSRTLEISGLRYAYTFNQGNPWIRTPILKKEGDKLFQDINLYEGEDHLAIWQEIMFFHFRHSKRWPL